MKRRKGVGNRRPAARRVFEFEFVLDRALSYAEENELGDCCPSVSTVEGGNGEPTVVHCRVEAATVTAALRASQAQIAACGHNVLELADVDWT